ncbi:MAG TPA: hypothetical protein PLL10_06850 [Elusimicrobiales bacterium]|nr:hypothetical protein [Elusimicrobiales bacterium]
MKIILAVLSVILCSGTCVFAQQKQPPKAPATKQQKTAAQPGNKAWFESTLKSMKTRVSGKFHSSGVRSGAVAAVRGSKMGDNAEKPYWKGGISEKAAKKLEIEKAEFAAALELAVAGKSSEAAAALQKFLTDNPDSTLTGEVKEALSMLNAVPAAETTTSTAATPQAVDK